MKTEPEVWDPSDAWLASLVRHLRGLPPGAPIPAALLSSWRSALRREVMRVGRARREGRDPYPPQRSARDPGRITAAELVMDLLMSPEGRFWISVAVAMPRMIAGWAEAERVRLQVEAWQADARARRAERREVIALRRYLSAKVGNGDYVAPEPTKVSPYAIAAANACSSSRVRVWAARLADHADAPAVLEEMCEVGAEAHSVLPLDLRSPEPGEPRGIWPDPPPPPLPEETPSPPAAPGEQLFAFVPGMH